MPKNWPSDTVRRQKGRQKNHPIPELRGWVYFEIKSNLFLPCKNCNKLEKEMFYRYVRLPGDTVGVTEAVCVSCSKLMPS